MLFKTALRRDLSNLAGIVFATLFTVMVTTSLIRWLGRAANGLTDTASVLPMIAFGAINLLPVLLVLTVDRKSTRLNSSHVSESRMPSSA